MSEPRRGYGHACLAGIAAAGGADVIVFLDGDHSDYPAQLVDVVAPILEGRADLVIGSRNRGRREAGAHPWHAVLGTRACVGLMNLLTGSRATDLGPFRAITAEALRRLDMRDRNYGWTVEMQVKAARAGAAGRRGAGRLPPAHRPQQGQRDRARDDRRGHEDRRHDPPPRRAASGPRRLARSSSRPASSRWASARRPPARIGPHLALFGAGVRRLPRSPSPRRAGLSRRGLLALPRPWPSLWRALLVAAPPLLSNDINRYVWEGRVQVHGGNPYRWSDRPESPRWLPLRDAVYEGLNHKDYTAVYPPLFVLATRAVVAVHDSFTAMKAFLVACELATLGGARASLLRRRRLPLERLLVLAWSPLALVEIAGSGHNEAFGMLWLVLALLALDSRPAAPLGSRRGGRAHVEVPARPRGRGVGAALPVVARARRASPSRRRSSPSTSTRLEADDAAEPLEVRAVLALQRDAVRAARRAPRLARGRGPRRARC